MRSQIKLKMMICCLCIWMAMFCSTKSVKASEEKEQNLSEEEWIEDLDLQQVQNAVNELLGEHTFQLKEKLEHMIKGEDAFSSKEIISEIREIVLSNLTFDRTTAVQIFLLLMVAAIFTNFAEAFGNGQTEEISFYIVYMLLAVIFIHSFAILSREISDTLEKAVFFMKALMPSYFLAVTAVSGSATAMVFNEMVITVIYLIQKILQEIVIPGIHVFMVLEIINYLHKEEFLSKMAELFQTVLRWIMNTSSGIMIGMQLVQNMVSPAVDSLKRSMIQKTAAAIPGVGNVINGVTEVAFGTAVLIKNSLGAAAILILLLIGLPPIIKLGITTLLYKFLAALAQPISDKRIVGCLSAMGDGCSFLLKVILMVEFLCLITIAILTVSFVGG